MKKKIILNSLAIFLGFASFAQSKESSTLWEIKGQGIKKSYVFGTVHMLPANEFVLKDKVVKALKSSDKLVMELDLDDPMLQMQYLIIGKLRSRAHGAFRLFRKGAFG